MLLAIDTSTELTGLACYDASGLLAECTWLSGRNHTAHVLPQVQLLLSHIQRDPSAIEAVAVARGPGSWSGLRVGLSIAKGMALAGNLALLGVGTLDLLAYQHQRRAMPVYPLIRLGRGRFATARFAYADGWQRQGDDQNVALAELCQSLASSAEPGAERYLFCGDIAPDVREQLRHGLGDAASFPGTAANLRRPGYLAELAWQRFAAGERDNLAQLEPRYLGEPVQPRAVGPTTST